MTRTVTTALVCLGLLLAQRSRAQEVELQQETVALVGQGQPRLTVIAATPLQQLRLELRRADGKKLDVRSGPHKTGERKVYELGKEPGTFRWEGQLSWKSSSGETAVPVSLETAVVKLPSIAWREQDVKLDEHRLTVSVDQPVAKLSLMVHSDEGTVLDRSEKALAATAAGAPVTLEWRQPSSARVMKLELRAEDRWGNNATLELFPWKIEIPHEDVLFASGRSEIPAGEVAKLTEALTELRAALVKYGRMATVELFVAGHTDTVGDGKSNQRLSEQRALAIAKWFRGQGIKIGISYAGAGEDRLLVVTSDETDEPRNRRVQYIVAIAPPTELRWSRLK